MSQEKTGQWKTTVFPVTMYKVSKEWVDILFMDIKRTIMSRAIKDGCPQDFLAALNELELRISNDAKIEVSFPKSVAASSTNKPLAAPKDSSAPPKAPTAGAKKTTIGPKIGPKISPKPSIKPATPPAAASPEKEEEKPEEEAKETEKEAPPKAS